jgi:hypothetical protein
MVAHDLIRVELTGLLHLIVKHPALAPGTPTIGPATIDHGVIGSAGMDDPPLLSSPNDGVPPQPAINMSTR